MVVTYKKNMEELKRLILKEKMKYDSNKEHIRLLQQILDLLIKKQKQNEKK
tara:strand:- start:578 stop:730 length:153 start_codon:yes stop_codon:yes gene_type:complete